MSENIITPNVTNWITVVVMAALGYAVFVFAVQGGKKFAARSAGPAQTQ